MKAYKILNLDRSKKITKDDVKKAHAKIQKKSIPIFHLKPQDYLVWLMKQKRLF